MVTGTHSSHALPSKRGVVLARLNASISALWALLALLLFSALLSLAGLPAARAVPSTIFPDQCYSNFDLLQWDVKRYGPYTICKGGTVRFQWKGMHGVFQIPSIACPTNFTSGEAESYKFLAPVGNGGGFEWKVPDPAGEGPGHYWITSQQPLDCKRGMVAEFFVVDPDMEPFPSARANGPRSWLALAVVALVSSWFLPI